MSECTPNQIEIVTNIYVEGTFPRFTKHGKVQWRREYHIYRSIADAIDGTRRLANNGSASGRKFSAKIVTHGQVPCQHVTLSGDKYDGHMAASTVGMPLHDERKAPAWIQEAITKAAAHEYH